MQTMRAISWPLLGVVLACGSPASDDPSAGDDSAGRQVATGGGRATGGHDAANPGSGGSTTESSGGALTGGTPNGEGAPAEGGAAGSSESGGEGGLAQSGGGGGSHDEGLPGAESFTRLHIRLDLTPHTGPPGPCAESSWSFDRESQELSWDFCVDDASQPEQGKRVLSDSEVHALLNVLSLVELVEEPHCVSDGSHAELELEVAGTTTLYQTNLICDPVGDGPLAASLHRVAETARWLRHPELPAQPEALYLSTGVVEPSADPDHCAPTPEEYLLDLATGVVTWSWCQYDPMTGERTFPSDTYQLDATQLESVRVAYAELEPGVSDSCNHLEEPESLADNDGRVAWIRVDGGEPLLDEVGSCYGGDRGLGFAIGISALAGLVESYLP